MHPYDRLRDRLAGFVAARDWQQFHSPKNLAACLSVEAGELLELYMWTREGDGPHPPGAGPPDPQRVEDEAADVLISLLNLAAALDLDLPAAAMRKLDRLEDKYPVAHARGNALRGEVHAARIRRPD
ncbi:MAG: MazG-like family protein [bacterium]|nr:nucleotide pyrophosphohydrolase [Myxococcales bacterium]MCB9552614.1 nucleotide pyrophosphohydrolase [Myxococcales bacterium]